MVENLEGKGGGHKLRHLDLIEIEVSVVSDDTNVWVNNSTMSYDPGSKREENQDGQQNQQNPQGVGEKDYVEKRGMKKMQSLMAMLQHIFLRPHDEPNGPGCIAQVHCPSQLLPRANWKTIHDRMARWAVYSSEGTGAPLGGEDTWALFKQIPLKLIIHCRGAQTQNQRSWGVLSCWLAGILLCCLKLRPKAIYYK